MTTETEFSFTTLSAPARRHIRVFQIHQFLDRFAMGLTVSVVALALSDRGMDLFQISLLFGVYALTTMVMELPFGGLADSVGRKPVFLTAVVASLVSLALFLSTRDFYVLAVSFACIGFGRAPRLRTHSFCATSSLDLLCDKKHIAGNSGSISKICAADHGANPTNPKGISFASSQSLMPFACGTAT